VAPNQGCAALGDLGMNGWWLVPATLFFGGGQGKARCDKDDCYPALSTTLQAKREERREEQMSLLSEDGDGERRYLERRIIAL